MFPEFYKQEDFRHTNIVYGNDTRKDKVLYKRIANEGNEKNFETNRRKIKLFLDIITIAAIQSCTEKVSEKDKIKITKVLMKRTYSSSSNERNNKGCKSDFRYRCGF